jgi:DDE superfamily endonuclease
VPDRRRPAQAQGRDGGHHRRSGGRPQKEAIDRAYRTAEALGIPLWAEDEAGPYQAIPQPGPSWQPVGHPQRQPHEYVRGGTAKLLTLFRPATGEVRAQPVERATNAVLHPWLKGELAAILAAAPPAPAEPTPGRRWADWEWHPDAHHLDRFLPPIRLILILDNLKGHHTRAFVQWCAERGILLLYTPVAGSWLNLAEALQRILVRRALAGQHPETSQQLMDWLAAEVRGWNADPTPFEWGGKRAARRQRARQRRHALGGAAGYTRRPIRRAA